MTTAILDAEDGDRAAVFARLAGQLGFDAASVPNLDALWDVLRTDVLACKKEHAGGWRVAGGVVG